MNTLGNLNGVIPGVMRAEDDMSGMGSIFLGNLALSFLLSYIFNNWAGIKTAGSGAQAGAMLGGLIALGYGLISHGTTNLVKIPGVLLDTFIVIIMNAVVGAVIGWWSGRGSK